jgi:hypothetical protein
MTNVRSVLLASAASLVVAGLASTAALAADQLLTGVISSPSGEKLGGVTVSAKQDGTTITTSVYTDESGNYYFPPLAAGKYSIWAQALGFETTKSSVDLSATKYQNLALVPMTDAERRIRQLPGELLVTALPEATEDDARIKKIFTNQCTGCHTPGYVLQFRFDEAGWNKIITMMKYVPAIFQGPGSKPNAIIDYNQKQLAAYLARARGPGESSMTFTPRPRPTGEAARVTWTLYDVPINPDTGIGPVSKYNTNDGTDWSLGTTSRIGQLPHRRDRSRGPIHRQRPQSRRNDWKGRRQDRRGEIPEGDGEQRKCRHRPRHHPRRRWQLLVRHQSGPPRPRQARREVREDHRLSDAQHDVATRRRRDHGHRR